MSWLRWKNGTKKNQIIENIDADICTICGAEYLTAELDEYIEKTMEKIFAEKIMAHQETVFRITAEV